MKLWKLYKRDDSNSRFGYDCSYGFVVRAESEERARELASTEAGDEGKGAWLDAEDTTCVELTMDGDEEIVLQDFHAG